MSDKYIIVRVKEQHEGSMATDVSRLRRALHDTMNHYGLDAADLVLSAEPNYVQSAMSGSTNNAKDDWLKVDIMFQSLIARAKRLAAATKKNSSGDNHALKDQDYAYDRSRDNG